ncbi:DUF4381 family protein [Granulosicoccus sp. 3-233]|uniref:DUF4381 family protein n=1 Tax=Granulosicoccus sp. 3-233 TaxID=3417969 RepID=UPI003D3419A1
MNETEQILSQLRDIQLPPAPEAASVWLIAANLMMLLMLLLGLYYRRRRMREQWRRDALFQLRQARLLEPAVATLALARLLRQILLYRQYPISGNARCWLAELDDAFDTQWFTQAQGRLFGDELYKPGQMSVAELQEACTRIERLIRRLPARPRNASRPQPSMRLP